MKEGRIDDKTEAIDRRGWKFYVGGKKEAMRAKIRKRLFYIKNRKVIAVLIILLLGIVLIDSSISINVEASYIGGDIVLQNGGFEEGMVNWSRNIWSPTRWLGKEVETKVEVVKDSFEGFNAVMIDGIGARLWIKLAKEVVAEGCVASIAVKYKAGKANYYYFFIIVRGQTSEGKTLTFGLGDQRGRVLAPGAMGSFDVGGTRVFVTTDVASATEFEGWTLLSLDVQTALSNEVLMQRLEIQMKVESNITVSLPLDPSKFKVIGIGFGAEEGLRLDAPYETFRFFADAVTIFSPHIEQTRIVTKIRHGGILPIPLDILVVSGGMSVGRVYPGSSVTFVTVTDRSPENARITIHFKPALPILSIRTKKIVISLY